VCCVQIGAPGPAPGIRNGANCEGFFHPNGTLFMACPSGGKTTAPNCNGQNAFLHMSRADSIEAAMAGNFTEMPVRVALAGTADPFLSVPAICFNCEGLRCAPPHPTPAHPAISVVHPVIHPPLYPPPALYPITLPLVHRSCGVSGLAVR